MKISKRHQRLSKRLKNPRVLNHPEEFLGPNWKAVLNFWIYVDTLTDEQWRVIYRRFRVMSADEWNAAVVAIEAATKTTPYLWNIWGAAPGYAGRATWELIGSHEILNQQKPFTFLSFFINP